MRSTIQFLSICLAANIFLSDVYAHTIQMLINKEDIYRECTDKPNYATIQTLMDTSKFNIEVADEKLILSGNITIIWDVEPGDRIEVKVNVYKKERGAWQPTLINASLRDICKGLWMENSDWFKIWGKHVLPSSRKCFSKGLVLEHEPFELSMKSNNIPSKDFEGHYKIDLTYQAFTPQGQRKLTPVCWRLVGECVKA